MPKIIPSCLIAINAYYSCSPKERYYNKTKSHSWPRRTKPRTGIFHMPKPFFAQPATIEPQQKDDNESSCFFKSPCSTPGSKALGDWWANSEPSK